jgi:predicted metal-dependent HD superfamily phosphohydrolase
MTLLQKTFTELLAKHTNDQHIIDLLWNEIESHYNSKDRHYHTLQHLDNLLAQLLEVKKDIQNWDATLFALYYHDIIYSVMRSDNEEKSAVLAEERMRSINVPENTITECTAQILATKRHERSPISDINYFTDADLSILGQDWETYLQYSGNVRKEYSVYPDLLYYPGRKKVLQHFLAMERIYKTWHFHSKLETQARRNMQRELESLSK